MNNFIPGEKGGQVKSCVSGYEGLTIDILREITGKKWKDMDEKINFSLKSLGEFTGRDRVEIFLYPSEKDPPKVYEWADEGIMRIAGILLSAPPDKMRWTLHKFSHFEDILVNRFQDLPQEAYGERMFFQMANIRSAFVTPLFSGENLIGHVGSFSIRKEKKYGEEELDLYRIMAGFFSALLGEERRAEELKKFHDAEDIIMEISKRFTGYILPATKEELYDGIDYSLKLLGDYFERDFIQIFVKPDLKYLSKVYEWKVGEKVISYDRTEDTVIYPVTCSIPEIKGLNMLIANHFQDLPEDAKSERDFWKNRNILSACLISMGPSDNKMGHIVICSTGKIKYYTRYELKAFMFLCEIFTNVIARAYLIEILEKARLEVEEANRAKSEFIANMSHEIRTPLNATLGMIGLLLDTDLSPEQKRFASIAGSSAKSLLNVINDILDFSKIEAGRLQIDTDDFDLRKTLENIMDVFALKAYEKGLLIALRIEPSVPVSVKGDPGRLGQIVSNLCSNALKFTEKGEVIVKVKLLEEKEESVELLFEISDTGIGIREEKLEKLFKSFSQVDSSYTRRYGGTGLGLAISKKLTEIMGGEIGVKSREGEGSTFWFTVVFKKQKKGIIYPSAEKALEGKRILVVDDNKTNILIITEMLHSFGFIAEDALSGKEALEKIRKSLKEGNPFDLALLDREMPEMDGIELGRLIKKETAIPLIMLSSVIECRDMAFMKEDFFSAHLTKPVKNHDLYSSIIKSLGISGDTMETVEDIRRSKGRILIVEDDEENQKIIKALLEREGHMTDVVGNGKEALENLGKMSFDLVLMDVQMPVMDGLRASMAIREKEESTGEHIPVIAITGSADRADRLQCISAGMDDYILKPVDPDKLLEIVSRYIKAGKENVFTHRKTGLKIIIAEDNITNQEVALNIFKNLGYNPHMVSNGKELLQAMEKSHYDIIFTDIQMPELDGFEAAKLIREKEKSGGKSVPIIAITAHAAKEDRIKCLESGMNDYISKPFTPKDLENVIERIITGRNVTSAGAEDLTDVTFDFEALLHRLENNSDMVKKCLSTGIEELAINLAGLREGAMEKDMDNLKIKAHSIKGISANINANKLRMIAEEIEVIAKKKEGHKIDDLIEKLGKEFEIFRKTVKQLKIRQENKYGGDCEKNPCN